MIFSSHGVVPLLSPPCTVCMLWFQYLTYLDSFGPFGEECWFTVHVSLSWLFDPAFTHTHPSDSTFKYIRRSFSEHVQTRLNLLSTMEDHCSHIVVTPILDSSPPPSPMKIIPTPTPPVKTYPPLSLRRQCPKQLRRKLPPATRLCLSVVIGRSKKKKRNHRQRRMDFYRKYYRPPKAPQLFHISLDVTTIPDKWANRSFGSANSLDPPC